MTPMQQEVIGTALAQNLLLTCNPTIRTCDMLDFAQLAYISSLHWSGTLIFKAESIHPVPMSQDLWFPRTGSPPGPPILGKKVPRTVCPGIEGFPPWLDGQ